MLRGEPTFITMPGEQSHRGKFKDLIAVTKSILTSKTSTQLYNQITNKLLKITGAKIVILTDYDKYNTTFIVNKSYHPKSSKLPKSFGWPIDLRLKKQWNFFKQGTLHSNKPSKNSLLNAEFVKALGIENILIAPMIISGEITGLLIVANRRGGFSEDHAHTLSAIAAQAAPLLANFRLQQEEQRRRKQLSLLNRLVTELSLIRDSQQLLGVAAEQIRKQFSYYLVATGWVDELKREVRFVHVFSRKQKDIPVEYLPIPFHRGLAGKAAHSGKTLYAGNLSSHRDEFLFLPEVKSEIACPVKIGDTVVAILDIQSDKPNAFDDSDRLVIETIGNALGSAIQNANAYQNLEKINAQLEEASRMKDEVLQIVAHDFRSPLTVIRGYLDQIIRKEKWVDTQQKEIMLTVSQQAFRLQTLADATLKASRFDSGDIPFSFEKTDFNSFLRNLLLPWSERHNFVVKTQKNLPLVRADAGRLQEAMENLISNAIKYSPDGGDITVRVRTISREEIPAELKSDGSHGSFLLVSISDQGIGIPPEKKELLFRRFARIHDSRRIEGAGLGLYITRKIIEAHGGRVWLQDQKKGSCFCFALPEYLSNPDSESILIVEDDAHILRLLHRAVSNLGYEVISAWNGREALDKVFRFQPRLIITDLMLPEINGEELIRRLRMSKETASLPVIIFTGKRDFNPEIVAGNNARVVFKNQGIDRLIELIREVMVK
jgi:signal transduction histidine kinase/CheY-like chemotaxis protein